jgi:hypothetical protein
VAAEEKHGDPDAGNVAARWAFITTVIGAALFLAVVLIFVLF